MPAAEPQAVVRLHGSLLEPLPQAFAGDRGHHSRLFQQCNSAEDEALQAEVLEKLFTIWFSHPAMEAAIYWNLMDGYAAFRGFEGDYELTVEKNGHSVKTPFTLRRDGGEAEIRLED